MLIPTFVASIAFFSIGDVLVPGKPAPAFTVDSFVRGQEVKTLELGKVHVIEFWATWCGPCVASMPHLTELQKQNPDVQFIGVAGFERGKDASDSKNRVQEFLQAKSDRVGFAIAFDGDGTMATEWMTAARRNTIPTSFVVGKDGNIAFIGSPNAELDAAIAEAKKAVSSVVPPAPTATKPNTTDSGSPVKTVQVSEEPTDEKGTSTTTSVSTETHSVTKNGVSSNSVVTVETTVEIRDGRRKTTVSRTEAGSSDAAKQSSGTTGAPGAKSSSGASGSSSGSSKSSSSGNQP
ncbi:MAG: TlpA disulfide reductase family protein [Planctomycetota bacterium]|nr:TlpA disulfide reductase family protein [Planctomycetota bacterium]